MSVFDASMIPMLEMFIFETTTLLEQLDEILLDAEKSQSMSQDNINEVFRIMHTIKGSSAMMGIEAISELAHKVEDMFFLVRQEPAILTAYSSAIFDLLFKSSDFLKGEVDSIQQSEDYAPGDSSGLVVQILAQVAIIKGEAPAEGGTTADVPEHSPIIDTATTTATDGLHQMRVFFEDGCQMENIRAFMLITQLKESCDFLESDPPNPEANSGCSGDIIKNGLLLSFRPSGTLEEINSIVESAVNIHSYEMLTHEEAAVVHNEIERSKAEDAGTPFAEHPATAVADPDSPVQAANNATKAALGKQSLISVNQIKLDQLMDIMGEIVIAESMVASNPELRGLKLDNFYKSTRQLRKLTDQLQDVVMSIRMVPLSGVFQKMNRIVRDMNKKLDKEVELVTIGGDTEVDKTINDVLADPFMHMIRNSMDHGIESPEERRASGKPAHGSITLEARNVGGEIVITLQDDGKGLDRDKILAKAKKNGLLSKPEAEYLDKEVFAMIMLAGFSTNEQVTEFSGRGVGMDVVKKNLEKVSGVISVDSVKDAGTTFTIKIPLTLAIVDGMEISVNHNSFTVPITAIRQTFKLSEETQVITDTNGAEMIMLRGDCYPIIRLHSIYNIKTNKVDLAEGILLLVESGSKAACIFADDLVGEQQVVVKPFPVYLSRYDVKGAGLSGCTIMGDGSISLILDINSFLNKY